MKDQAYTDFVTSLANRNKPRKSKITNSWGVRDAHKAIRKHKWFDIGRPVSEKEFYAIIRGINKLFAEDIKEGKTVVFPQNMGKLVLTKCEAGVSIVDGRLKNTYPIDWSETLKLWYEDEEAKRNKTLLRDEQKYIFKVRYDKKNADYVNKVFYAFVLNIYIKKALKEKIKAGKLETLW